jgi:acetyl-CoA carboxylase carboxyl transferase subunit alpha
MMENSIYSVISPEGCASIMWRDATKRELAAEAMKITAGDLIEMRLVDEIAPEPPGGAQNDWDAAARLLDQALQTNLAQLRAQPLDEMLARRYDKFRKIAQFYTE